MFFVFICHQHPTPVPAMQNNQCLEACNGYVETEFEAADCDDGECEEVEEVCICTQGKSAMHFMMQACSYFINK